MGSEVYARTYRANAVLTASPGRLVLMLYDGALKSLAIARDALGRDTPGADRLQTINTHLLKAQAILYELQNTLNFEAGGELARTLHRLYDYQARRLLEANLRKQAGPVIEVERLVGELRAAWAEMLAQGGAATDTATRGAA